MLRGVLVPMPTPLTHGERVDLEAVGRLVAHNIDSGVDGLWLLGTIGRFDLVPDAEQRRLVEAVCELAVGRTQLVVNVSDLGTARTAAKARLFADLPIDACAVLPPWFRPYGPGELLDYFRQLAEQLPWPVVLYNATWTCNTLSLEQMTTLAGHERIVGVKDTDQGIVRMQNWPASDRRAAGFSYLHATHLLAASARLGSDGLVGGLTGVVPELAVPIWRFVQDGDFAAADRLQSLFLRLARAVDLGPDIACLEALYRARGLCRRLSASPQRELALDAAIMVQRVLDEVLTEMSQA
jgi:dihydrodipicolinate synthase/N-acetylneuraminate lyase